MARSKQRIRKAGSLTLYVTTDSLASLQAIANLKKLLARGLEADYSFKIVDVSKDTEAADKAKIIATPTLFVQQGSRRSWILGDLSKTEEVLSRLQVLASDQPQSDLPNLNNVGKLA